MDFQFTITREDLSNMLEAVAAHRVTPADVIENLLLYAPRNYVAPAPDGTLHLISEEEAFQLELQETDGNEDWDS